MITYDDFDELDALSKCKLNDDIWLYSNKDETTQEFAERMKPILYGLYAYRQSQIEST